MSYSDLSTRFQTSIVMLAIVVIVALLALFIDSLSFLVAMLGFVICALASYEVAKLCSAAFEKKQKGLLYIAVLLIPNIWALLLGVCTNLNSMPAANLYILGVFVALCLFAVFLALTLSFLCFRQYMDQVSDLLKELLPALILVVFGGTALIMLGALFVVNKGLLLWLALVVCCNDIAAYFVGSKLRGPKLSPLISPNKTISGSVGGIVAGMLIGFFCGRLVVPEELSLIYIGLPLALSVVIAAQLGDLIKSYLKRLYNVKDMGNLLPGHGGILDRFDALLMAAPVLLVWVLCFEVF